MGGSVFAMFHLDYLSCFLTILATILLARKLWIRLLVAIVNSVIICAIGLLTLQLGFIPASLFCICAYAFNMRPWLKESIIDPELNICNKDRTSGGTPCALT
jgi:hypothetical protein